MLEEEFEDTKGPYIKDEETKNYQMYKKTNNDLQNIKIEWHEPH